MNDDYIKENFIAYNPDDYADDSNEEKAKKSSGKGGAFIFIGVVLIAIAIIGGGILWGISAYNTKQAAMEKEILQKKYVKLIKGAEDSIKDGEYDDAMDDLEAALDMDVEDHKDVYEQMAHVYVGYAGEKYTEAKKLSRDKKYDMAGEALLDAYDYLDDAEAILKKGKIKGKLKINNDAFYDCAYIADARAAIAAVETQLAEDSKFETVAIELFYNAWEYLEDYDFDKMNELDCSDESNDVFDHYVGGAYGKRLIATYSGSELELVSDSNNFTGKGISQNTTSTGFYYYLGDFEYGYPSGEGILFISSTNGDYHVEVGTFSYGCITGKASYFVREKGEVTDYCGEVNDWGHFEGEVVIWKEIDGKRCSGTAYYEFDDPVSMAEHMDEEEYEALVEELESMEEEYQNPFGNTSSNDEYYAFLYDEDGELVCGLTKNEITDMNLHY